MKVPHTLLGAFQVTFKLDDSVVTGEEGKVTTAIGVPSIVLNDDVLLNMLLPKLFCTVTLIQLTLCRMETYLIMITILTYTPSTLVALTFCTHKLEQLSPEQYLFTV